MLSRLLALICVCALLLIAFFGVIKPWYLTWGATPAEVHGALPSDMIIPNAKNQETRAITINANVDRVWPWLAQLGQDRGGFYSFDLLENSVGCEMPTSDVLQPDKQQWAIGDRLWMYPKAKAGGQGFATLRVYLPAREMGFGTHMLGTPARALENGSWSFTLVPLDPSHTRLLIRGRGAPGRSLLGVTFDQAIFEPIHFVMERRTMIGLKQLAEEGQRYRIVNHVQILAWVLTFCVMCVGFVGALRRRQSRAFLALFAAAAIVFQILTFVQPSVTISWMLAGSTAFVLWRIVMHHRSSSHYQ